MKRLLRPTLLRPTLVRRVMLAMLLAFMLVWLVLMGRQLYQATDTQALDQNLHELGSTLLASITPVETPGEARAVVAAMSALVNDGYRKLQAPGAVLMELADAQGRRLFLSPEARQTALHGVEGTIGESLANGRRLRIYRGHSERWTLTVAVPMLDPWWIASTMSAGLTMDMLIALPFVLLPLWFAVSRGLRPLHVLSAHIASRDAGDLAPLGVTPRYAELQPLTSALDHLLARLRHKVEREHGFVQDAAHELRTPLAVLSAQAHVLAMADDAPQRAQAGRSMAQAIARASHLIGQLLDLAQMDRQATLAPARQDVAQLLRQELATLAPLAFAREIDLSLEAPDTLFHAIDTQAFQSIVHNLVNNALAYVPRQGQLRLELLALPGGLQLSVADDGPGIAADQRALVFERFYRGSGQAAPGAGLGLAIVREAAKRLHGTVALTDGIDGRGCCFTVTIGTAG